MFTDAPADPLIGKTVAQYEVLAKLGGGGMGVVYKARDSKLGRAVALKFLPPQWSHDETAKQRFVREAQAASATNHRNICVIHDIGQSDDGQLFIVMAYYDGQTLKQHLEGGALPLNEALEIAVEAAEGLAKAHQQGVVHRDIKPGNLMITDDGLKILDFGLAKFADAVQLTIPGSTVGTVAYMSPEQARGEEADARSDLWALGIVVYEMLAGQVPFKGAYAEAILHAIKNEPVPPLGWSGRDIPEALETLVFRALEKDPEKRLGSARELARELRVLQGRSVPLDLRTEELPGLPPLKLPWPKSWWRAGKHVTMARASVALGLVVAAGLMLLIAWPVDRIPVAVAPVANLTGEPALDDYRLALTEALTADLRASPNIRVVPYLQLLEILRPFLLTGRDVSSRDVIQAVAAASGTRVIVVPSLNYHDGKWMAKAEFRNVDTGTSSRTYETESIASSLPKDTAYRLTSSLVDGTEEHFKSNWPGRGAQRRPASGRFHSLDAARAFEQGLNAYELQEYSAALSALRQTVKDDPQQATAFAWMSRVVLILGDQTEAVAAAQRARQLLDGETPKADASFVEAVLAEARRDLASAERQYRRVSTLRSDDSDARIELADFLKRQYKDRDAVEAYHEVLRLRSGYVRPHVDLCQLYTRLGEHPLAEQHAKSAVDTYRGVGNRAGEAQALLCLGEVQRMSGGEHLAEAQRSIESARGLFESSGGLNNLARVYKYSGNLAFSGRDFTDAARWFERALPMSRQVGNLPLEGLLLMDLGATHLKLGQRREALDYYRQSSGLYERIGEPRRAAEAEVDYAGLLVDYGSDQEEALRRASNARATLQKLGFVDFELLAAQAVAAGHRYAGRHKQARTELQAALSLARARQLGDQIEPLTVDLAQSYMLLNEYEETRTLLEKAVASAGKDDPQARIQLGRVYTRLGDFASAGTHLEAAERLIDAGGLTEFTPAVVAARGELAYEAGRLEEARKHFNAAAALWTDDLPDAVSVEARCYLGILTLGAPARGLARMERDVEASVAQARAMGRLYLESRCRLALARLRFSQRRYDGAIETLNAIPPDDEDRSIGRELRSQIHYWRGRALDARGDLAAAASEKARARTLMRELQELLRAEDRDRFRSRPDIRSVLE